MIGIRSEILEKIQTYINLYGIILIKLHEQK